MQFLDKLQAAAFRAVSADAAGLAPGPAPGDAPEAGGSLLEGLVRTLRPGVILEVGSGDGRVSALLGRSVLGNSLPARVVCVDTWFGAVEELCSGEEEEIDRAVAGSLGGGWADFLSRVAALGTPGPVVPFRQIPRLAAVALEFHGIRAGLMVYHASAGRDDLAAELSAFLPLLEIPGVIAGRDISPLLFPHFRQELREFSLRRNLPLRWAGDWFVMGSDPSVRINLGADRRAATGLQKKEFAPDFAAAAPLDIPVLVRSGDAADII